MEYLYVDPSLLAIPNYGFGDGALVQIVIRRVIQLSLVIMSDDFLKIVIPSNIEEFLWGENCAPTYESISTFLELSNAEKYFSASDLFSQYLTIMQRAVRSRDACPIIVEGVTDFDANPKIEALAGMVCLLPQTVKAFTTTALIKRLDPRWCVASPFPVSTQCHYTVSALVTAISGSRINDVGAVPITLKQKVASISDVRQFISEETAKRLWETADGPSDIHGSVTVTGLALLMASGVQESVLKKFFIGVDFIESLKANQCFGDGRFADVARELCGRIVAGICNRSISPFGKPQQRIRKHDHAAGFRVHLTESGLALRLMYWEKDDKIEFANVGPKKELLISSEQEGAFTGRSLDFMG